MAFVISGVIFVGGMLGAPGFSSAHSLYIQSSRYTVHDGKKSPLFFCYGHHIPVDDGLRAKKIKQIRVYAPDGKWSEVAVRPDTCLQSHMVAYDQPGTWVLTAETNPGYYTVYTDFKGRERHTIKPKTAIKDQAKSIEKSLYSSQFTKTYVVCDTPSETFPAQVGLTLELVPQTDISTVKAGETLTLKVYYKGKPYMGKGTWDATYSGFSTASEDNYYPKTEVIGDTVNLFVPNTGRWFVRYFFKTDATGEALKHCTQIKHTATLVFEVPNARKRPGKGGH
ncbi:MAG: hypothetical protein CSA22_03345 [Deltaproteobacteria bacterium]|nr:MAG: hypothetical protein CSA22_03345 [Deltaproteobacteria bacterium]